jgi:hypothetical protein
MKFQEGSIPVFLFLHGDTEVLELWACSKVSLKQIVKYSKCESEKLS